MKREIVQFIKITLNTGTKDPELPQKAVLIEKGSI
jgi:hypothetical protein